jgi:hypothetical protein
VLPLGNHTPRTPLCKRNSCLLASSRLPCGPKESIIATVTPHSPLQSPVVHTRQDDRFDVTCPEPSVSVRSGSTKCQHHRAQPTPSTRAECFKFAECATKIGPRSSRLSLPSLAVPWLLANAGSPPIKGLPTLRQLCRFACLLALVAAFPALSAAQTDSSSAADASTVAQRSGAAEKQPDSSEPGGNTKSGAKQPNDRPDQRRQGSGVAESATEVKPEVHYLRDRQGQLVPVPGISYEDFVELFRLKQELDQPPEVPRYSLRELIGEGQAKGDNATIQIQLRLRLNETGWTAVPLDLSQCTLTGPAVYKGDGDYLLHFDSKSNQYILWLNGRPRSDHELSLNVVAPLSANGIETALQLSLPKAAASKLVLDVPGNVTANSNTTQSVVDVIARDDTTSTLSTIGVASNFTLTWSPRDRSSEPLPLLLETTGAILVTIDGRSVRSEIDLTVRSFGREFQEFRVRLPKASVLVGGQQQGYTLTSVGAAAAPMVHVKLNEKTSGPVNIKFATERTYDVSKPDELLELAGFEVVEAPSHRQGGQIGVLVSGDWQVIWENPRVRVRQIDQPSPQLDRRGLLAAFEYVGRQCSLPVRVAPRRTHVAVEPEYVYHVDHYETRLEARLKYSIRGAKVFSLELDLPGWTVDEVGPPTIVDINTLAPGEDARLIVPLVQPTIGDVALTLKARRPHSSNPDDLEISLPTLVADSPKPATVIVLPADNVELQTRSAQLVGLSPQGMPSGLQLPLRRQPPLVFRAERTAAKYVAALTVQPRRTSVRVTSTAHVGRDRIDVEERFNYQVLYEPIDRLHLVAPASFGPPVNWQLSIADRRLTPQIVAAGNDLAESTRYQVVLSSPRLGQIELVSRYAIPLPPEQHKRDILEIPLPMPSEGELTGNTLAIETERGLRADVQPGNWTRADSTLSNGKRGLLSLSSPTAANSVSVSLALDNDRPVAGSVVERAWIQTWLIDDSRQERALFRIRSRARAIAINLPTEAVTSDMEVMLDGRPIQPTLNGQRRLALDWPTDESAHVLELRYRLMENPTSLLSAALMAPQFDDDVHIRRTYWQLVVPRDQHLLSAAPATSEFHWRWDGLTFKRLNLLDQSELEEWAGGGIAPAEGPLPQSANVYLFSASRPDTLHVSFARRGMLVLISSAVCLIVAILLMRFSALRRAWALAVLGVALIVFALAYPDLAILLGQASLIGVLLAGMALFLRGALRRHDATGNTIHPGSSLFRDRSVTETHYRPAQAAPVSTASRAVGVEHAATESHAG